MKVGDYVRTKDGRISKIYDIQKNDLYILEDYNYSYNSDWLVISSPNIIGLIQEGDYVNGEKITEISESGKVIFYWDYDRFRSIENNSIKSIVTKEQFEAMEYRIGE